MDIKEYFNKDIIFSDISVGALEVYNNNVNTHDFTSVVGNNYNNYKSNNEADEYGANNKEDITTHEDGAVTNTTHEDGTI